MSVPCHVDGDSGLTVAIRCGVGLLGAPGRLPLALGQCWVLRTLVPAWPFSHPAHTSFRGGGSFRAEQGKIKDGDHGS